MGHARLMSGQSRQKPGCWTHPCGPNLQVAKLADDRVLCVGVLVYGAVPPRISRGPVSRSEVEGSSVALQCQVLAAPFPDTVISWTKDDRPLDVRILYSSMLSRPDCGLIRLATCRTGHRPRKFTYFEFLISFLPIETHSKITDHEKRQKIVNRALTG